MTETETKRLTKYQTHLVETHLNLAHRIALEFWRKAPETMEKNEVVAVAYQGLLTAAQRFDSTWTPENDPKYDPFLAFGSFARRRITGSIIDWQRSRDHVPKRQRRVYKTLQQHGHGAGRSPEELADMTGLNVEKIRAITQAVETTAISLDQGSPDDGYSLHEEVSSPFDTERSALVSSIQDIVADTFVSLPPLQRSIIVLRYYEGRDLTSIAVELGVASSVVRTSHRDAIELIHSAMQRAAAS